MQTRVGIDLSGGKARIDGSIIASNDFGLVVQNNAVADLGDLNRSNITGLGASGGKNEIAGNAFGISNSTSSIVRAENNWWGSFTGPFHPLQNPTGQGNRISDLVDFRPFLNSPPVLEDLINDVRELASAGELALGQAESLTKKLEKARAFFEVDDSSKAAKRLETFIKKLSGEAESILVSALNSTAFADAQISNYGYKNRTAPRFTVANGARAGYDYSINIIYPTKNRPRQGFFVQLNRIDTFVVTRDGKIHLSDVRGKDAPPQKFIADVLKIGKNSRSFPDQLGGPDFDRRFVPDVAIVFSLVRKMQGFTANQPPEKNKATFSDVQRFEALKKAMEDSKFANGIFEYSYIFVDTANYKKAFGNAELAKTGKMLAQALTKPLKGKNFESQRINDMADGFKDAAKALEGVFKQQKKDPLNTKQIHSLHSPVEQGVFGRRAFNFGRTFVSFLG
ncbi:MAG: hypothetical protein KatS3mg105_2615 [Gemmatales bacterium]|nr:MAG: hypothetical protein KatS3mg105_2615 [Gemmatales bacterium]